MLITRCDTCRKEAPHACHKEWPPDIGVSTWIKYQGLNPPSPIGDYDFCSVECAIAFLGPFLERSEPSSESP
jgi:hypothetical protein